jgi:hypothetical protein
MRLTKKALKKVDQQEIRLKLALALGFTEAWVITLIARNKDNGPLTLAKALQVIVQETGLKQEEILEAEEPASI